MSNPIEQNNVKKFGPPVLLAENRGNQKNLDTRNLGGSCIDFNWKGSRSQREQILESLTSLQKGLRGKTRENARTNCDHLQVKRGEKRTTKSTEHLVTFRTSSNKLEMERQRSDLTENVKLESQS